ncbi:MAG: hypothetical protein ABI402_01060 [Ferruginibacter sp.]
MKLISTTFFIAFAMLAHAQKVKLTEGSLDNWSNDTAYNIIFTYDSMHVGDYKNEEDYIADHKDALNKKKPGMGDQWAINWRSNKKDIFEPKFIEMFSNFTGSTVCHDATYTIIVHTIQTNVGFNVAGGMFMGSSKSAFVDAEVTVVKTSDPAKKIAVITIDGAKGRTGNTTSGAVNDGGLRISESYASAGKALAKFLKKQ